MHQRYNKLKYHKLYHSIPISCALALLLLTVLCISPIGSKGIVSSDGNASAADLTTSSDDISAALIVDDGNIEDVILAESGVNYKSHNIKIKAANVESYTLQISASSNGTSELKLDGGNTTIPGAGGVVGSNMPTNTWGYAWGAENATEDSMTYYTLPAYGSVGTTISTGLLASDTPTNNTIDTSNKLSFAANFSDSIPSGHYTTSVLLSLAVEPKAVVKTWDTMEYMQDMTSEICASQPTPAAGATSVPTKTLTDIRDNEKYTVSKLPDGKCWMTQNLRLKLTTAGLKAENTDITADWTNNIQATVYSNGSGTNTPVTDTATAKSFYNNDFNTVGVWYVWSYAVAGTATSGTASGSICPKNWRLPTIVASGDFDTLFKLLNIDYTIYSSNWSWAKNATKIADAPYNFVFGGIPHSKYGMSKYNTEGAYQANPWGYLEISSGSDNFDWVDGPYANNLMSVRCVAR